MRVLIVSVLLLAAVQRLESYQVLTAINCGGEAFKASTGILYKKDTNTAGYTWTWNLNYGGIYTDYTIYNTCRYNPAPLTYTLSLDGDGWYCLFMHFSDDSKVPGRMVMDVVLNGKHTVLDDFDMYKECGDQNVCNKAIYFHVCNGILYFNNVAGPTIIYDELDVEFIPVTLNAVIDGIMLVKGKVGEAFSVVKWKDIVFFDPRFQRKCVKAKPTRAPRVPAVPVA
jgi:Malectin domain